MLFLIMQGLVVFPVWEMAVDIDRVQQGMIT